MMYPTLSIIFASDESTFRLVRGRYKLVRRPSGVSKYDSRYTIKTLKHPKSVMVCTFFLFFLYMGLNGSFLADSILHKKYRSKYIAFLCGCEYM